MKIHQYLLGDKRKAKQERELDIVRKIRLTFPCNVTESQASSLLGPLLGQYGINISSFFKQFNEKTSSFDSEVVVIIFITLYRNKSFYIEIKGISNSYLIYENYNFNKVFKEKGDVAFNSLEFQMSYTYPKSITLIDFYRISKFLFLYDGSENIRSICKMLKGTLNSMNIDVINK
jgi:ribosomal protein L11